MRWLPRKCAQLAKTTAFYTVIDPHFSLRATGLAPDTGRKRFQGHLVPWSITIKRGAVDSLVPKVAQSMAEDLNALVSKQLFVSSAVANHGVSQELVDEQFSASKRFFAQPLESKLALKVQQSPSSDFLNFAMQSESCTSVV